MNHSLPATYGHFFASLYKNTRKISIQVGKKTAIGLIMWIN